MIRLWHADILGGKGFEATLTSSEALDKFNLSEHGDRHEQEGWRLLADQFPNYELFWRRFVVPLTNRTGDGPRDSSWIRLRSNVPAEWEKLAVCHYSVFYHLARAVQRRIELFAEKECAPTHPEDVIYLLQTCCENVSDFYDALRSLANNAVSYLPRQSPKEFPFREINAYRNLLLHNPVLGRGELHGETLLPKLPEDLRYIDSWASNLKFSWTAVERLPKEDFISARTLLQELENGLARYLNGTWAKLISDLGDRLPVKFQFLKVSNSVAGVDSSCGTLAQPLAASATFNNHWTSEIGDKKMPR